MKAAQFEIRYSALAEQEILEALAWYDQDTIRMGSAFLAQIDRTAGFLSMNPNLYPKALGVLRRANLKQFPYALFYLVEGHTVRVMSCFHQSRQPLQ
jgi:plasmid stabilization system protein ParE